MIGTHFSALDWIIVVTYLGATLATGLYGRKFVGGIADFLVAGRELGTFLAVATLAATEIGTITFMYYAELGYKTGYASFVNGLIAGWVMIFLGRTGFIVKRLRAMRLMTVPESSRSSSVAICASSPEFSSPQAASSTWVSSSRWKALSSPLSPESPSTTSRP